MHQKKIRPDSKGRIALGPLAKGVSAFVVTQTKDHKIVLEPYSEIPTAEKWLFENKTAMKQVKQGLKDANAGRLVDKGSFASFLEDEEEDN